MAAPHPARQAVLWDAAQFPAVPVARMQALDAQAIEQYHIPRLLLMEQAGFALAQAVRNLLPHEGGRAVICCGLGFNGGDGLAAARHLHAWGIGVRVILAGPACRLREEPAIFARTIEGLGLERLEIKGVPLPVTAERWLTDSDVIVDALLGIGVQQPVREPLVSLIEAMNRAGKPIVAADVPSGLNADTGVVEGIAVRAHTTVTFGFPKQGCRQGAGPQHTGRLWVAPIGFPRALLEGV